MPDSPGPWIINVGGRAYGPFGAEQMRAFAAEGRLVAMSQVARAGETECHNALDDPDLARFFVPGRRAPVTEPDPVQDVVRPASFGKLDDAGDAAEASELSHFVIISDMKSNSISALEEELGKLGPSCTVLPQVWFVTTRASISAVRGMLVQQLGKLDSLIVIDATRDKAAWFNFGPEMDARLRRFWSRRAERDTGT